MAADPDDALNRRIISVATELFQAEGFQGATADEISEAAGITKRTLYRRMVNKENILFEIHSRFLRTLQAALEESRSQGTDESLKRMAFVHLETIAQNQGAIRVLYEEMKHLRGDRRAAIMQQRNEYWEIVQSVLQDEVAGGRIRAVNLSIAEHGLLGALNETYRWFRPSGKLTTADIAELTTKLFLDGLMPASPPRDEVAVAAMAGDLTSTSFSTSTWTSDPVRSQIMTKATELFATAGYQGMTTREIAEAVGMTKANLYYHIGSKEELLFQIIHRMNEESLGVISALAVEKEPPDVQLVRMIVSHARLVAQHQAAVAVFNEDAKHLSAEKRAVLIADRDKYTKLWESVLRRGQRAGAFEVENIRVTVLLMMGMLNSMYRWYRSDGAMTPDEIGVSLAEIVLGGLRHRELVPARV